jgi:NAD(P)-dependent dehydrogenase (short-subunit alcohol dehydrogenase family)
MTRRVFLTGIAGGIGSAAAAAFAADGWLVAGVDVSDPGMGAAYDARQLDVGAPDAEARLRRLFEELGSLDAVVNAAGIQNTGTAVTTGDEEWARIQAVNVRGALWVNRAALPYLRTAGGSVVNVSSVHAVATTRGAAAYAASKAALVSLTRSLALEWAPEVRVNCVLPGAIDTPMLAEGLTREGSARDPMAELARNIPLGRVGRPEDVARAILFLADSDQSSFVTGQTLIVDGGVLAGLATQ